MKNIYRQASFLLIFFCLWYLVLFLVTYLFYSDSGEFGSYKNGLLGKVPTRTIFLDSGANVDLGFWVSQHKTHRIILTGASNTGEGLKPPIMQEVLPSDFTIYNATMGGSNSTEIRQILDVARMSNPGSMKGTIFIIGVFFGTFFNDSNSRGHFLLKGKNLTVLQAEALRYGLYKPSDNSLKLTISPAYMPVVVRLLRPILMWNLVFHDIKVNYDLFWAHLKHQNPKGEAAKQIALGLWKDGLGDIKYYAGDAQMNDFANLCQEIEESGASVVVVDLPVPPWLHDRSEHYQKYLNQRKIFVNKINALPRAFYIDLLASLPDTTDMDFRDSVHPTPEAAIKWSRAVSENILSQRQMLGF